MDDKNCNIIRKLLFNEKLHNNTWKALLLNEIKMCLKITIILLSYILKCITQSHNITMRLFHVKICPLAFFSAVKVDCLNINCSPVKTVVDDLIQKLFDTLVVSLKKSLQGKYTYFIFT